MDSKQRLQHLAGIPITESMEVDMGREEDVDMEMSDEGPSGTVCPFCGTEVEHGTLVEHIKTEHADMIALYKEMHGEDEEGCCGEDDLAGVESVPQNY